MKHFFRSIGLPFLTMMRSSLRIYSEKHTRVLNDRCHLTILIFGVVGVDEDALNTNGFETLNILGNIVAKLENTSSDIPCGKLMSGYAHAFFRICKI